MIKGIDITNTKNAEAVLNIQIPSYRMEADLIGSYDIPPLEDEELCILKVVRYSTIRRFSK